MSFPQAVLPGCSDVAPIEVSLLAQLGIGSGDFLAHSAAVRQREHETFNDALDEPSARIGPMHPGHADHSTLHTFLVGTNGHQFHRHAGNRVFIAVSGSGGARLRFATADSASMSHDPGAFARSLRQVTIPPDCLFTVRFGGGTWHQFLPLHDSSTHPALFAISCHPDERAGTLSDEQRNRVAANDADIASLTDPLPGSIASVLADLRESEIPTTALWLHAPPHSLRARCCGFVRRSIGRCRSTVSSWRSASMLKRSSPSIAATDHLPESSLLQTAFPLWQGEDDVHLATIPRKLITGREPSEMLSALLDGFVRAPPRGVSVLMRLRNASVRPWRLRVSPLGCPASSLLCETSQQRFAGGYPVLAQKTDAHGAEVLLGADDRHLGFRTCIGVAAGTDGSMRVHFCTRVITRNRFGAIYMRLVAPIHRHYIAPSMLRHAIRHALPAKFKAAP